LKKGRISLVEGKGALIRGERLEKGEGAASFLRKKKKEGSFHLSEKTGKWKIRKKESSSTGGREGRAVTLERKTLSRGSKNWKERSPQKEHFHCGGKKKRKGGGGGAVP